MWILITVSPEHKRNILTNKKKCKKKLIATSSCNPVLMNCFLSKKALKRFLRRTSNDTTSSQRERRNEIFPILCPLHVSFEYTLLVKGPTCFSLSVLGFVKKLILHLTAGSARADKETCGLIVLTFCSLTLEENEKE